MQRKFITLVLEIEDDEDKVDPRRRLADRVGHPSGWDWQELVGDPYVRVARVEVYNA